MNWRTYFSPALRLKIRLGRRIFTDVASGNRRRFAKPRSGEQVFPYEHSLSQPIHKSAYSQNKIHNLTLGIRALEKIVVMPDELFSFWHIIPKPIPENGYKVGRNLIGGTLSEDFGGGLCQLSSILYHIALQTGFRIVERHPHSLDIYEEHERFTPLGSDATVVFGYKDMRFQNPYAFPIRFAFDIDETTLTCRIQSAEPLPHRNIIFQREMQGNKVNVQTLHVLNKTSHVLETSVYRRK